MSKFLVRANKLDIYTNDLVRYYTDDLDHLEFGIVNSYDRSTERLTVSALNKSYPKASNVIERYSEEDWQSMTFMRQANNYVTVQIAPFNGNFVMMTKPTSQNMLLQALPYKKTLTTNIFTIFDGGLENFLNQVRFTAERIINSTILRYDINMRDNYVEGKQDKRLLEYYFPHKGTLAKPLVMSMDYESTSQLKRLVLHEIESMINNMVDGDIQDSGYSVDDPSYIKKSNYKDLERLKELEFPYTGHNVLRLERLESISGVEIKNEVLNNVLRSIDDYIFNHGKTKGKIINTVLPVVGSVPISLDRLNLFSTTNEIKSYVVNMIGKYIDNKVVGDEITNEESLAMYRHLHSTTTFPVTFNTQLQLKIDLDSQDPAMVMYQALNTVGNVIDYDLLGMESPKELEVELPYSVSRSMSVEDLLKSSNQSQFYDVAVGDLEEFINFDLLKSNGSITSDLPIRYSKTASVEDMLKNGVDFSKISMIDGASDFIDDDIIQHYQSQDSNELPHIETEKMDSTRTLMNDSSWNFYLDTALYKARKYIEQNQIPKYTYNDRRIEVEDIPYTINKEVSVLELLQASNTVNEETTTQEAFDYIMSKAKDFKYFVLLTNKQFILPLYLTGEPLENTTNSALRETIINAFEDILSWYNANNATIETKKISHDDIDRVVPFIQSMEIVPSQTNNKNVVFRVFLTDDTNIYKAFIMINDRRKFKGIVFSSPHIYSENNLVLKNFDRDEDPMIYNKEDYLRLLLTHNKQAILNCCKA